MPECLMAWKNIGQKLYDDSKLRLLTIVLLTQKVVYFIYCVGVLRIRKISVFCELVKVASVFALLQISKRMLFLCVCFYTIPYSI